MLDPDFNKSIALFLLRAVTGILFFSQGYDKIFIVKIKKVIEAFQNPIEKSWIPNALLYPFSWITSSAEMIGGIFLILGLFREAALLTLGINMLLVAFAFSSIKAMWDMHHYFPRFLFILILLLLPAEWDRWTIDALLAHFR